MITPLGGDRFQQAASFDAACGVVDVAPTILDGLGLAVPHTMHGRSLLAALAKDQAEQSEKIWELGRGQSLQELSITTVAGGHAYINGGRRLQ